MACAEAFVAAMDDWRGHRTGVTSFHDCSGLDDYDVEARERISAWSRAHSGAFDGVHLLVHGRTIAWGLQLLSTVSRANVTTYHSFDRFDSEFKRRVVVVAQPNSRV